MKLKCFEAREQIIQGWNIEYLALWKEKGQRKEKSLVHQNVKQNRHLDHKKFFWEKKIVDHDV